MPLREILDPSGTDAYRIADRWTLECELAEKLMCMAMRADFGLWIISGYRTPEYQLELKRQGRPAADPEVSNHCACPSRAADLWPTVAVTDVVKARFGEAATVCGLRWGGGSPVDPDTGIPSDWNHVDLGPRPR